MRSKQYKRFKCKGNGCNAYALRDLNFCGVRKPFKNLLKGDICISPEYAYSNELTKLQERNLKKPRQSLVDTLNKLAHIKRQGIYDRLNHIPCPRV